MQQESEHFGLMIHSFPATLMPELNSSGDANIRVDKWRNWAWYFQIFLSQFALEANEEDSQESSYVYCTVHGSYMTAAESPPNWDVWL